MLQKAQLTCLVKRLLLSTGTRRRGFEFAKAFGADRVFTKPLHLAELIGAIEELLGSKAVS